MLSILLYYRLWSTTFRVPNMQTYPYSLSIFYSCGEGVGTGGVVEWPWRTFHSFAVLYLYGCRISRSMKAYMFDVWSSIPRSNMSYLSTFFSLKLTWPLKIGLPPQTKNHLPASDFQVLQYVLVSGRVRILDLCCTVLCCDMAQLGLGNPRWTQYNRVNPHELLRGEKKKHVLVFRYQTI